MKAISLWQPWATAMALGEKKIETRGWYTGHRGWLAIHAAKRWTREEKEIAEDYLPEGTPIPLGAVVAVGKLIDCVRTEIIRDTLTPVERSWGSFTDGRFGWVFSEILPIDPVPFKGMQGFFNVPDEALRDARRRILPNSAQIVT